MKYSDIQIQPLANHKFKVLQDIIFEDIVVPKGYKTNGADIPRVFWSIYPPNRADYLPAVILHDYLCDLEEYKKADDIFEKALRMLGVHKRTIWILVKAVRFWHRVKYGIK